MQDTKLFETILGISAPWYVARVDRKTEEQRVELWLAHEATRWPCERHEGRRLRKAKRRQAK